MDYKKQDGNNKLLFIDNVLITEEIIEEAYEDGFINWNIYRKARDRIRTVLNGSWMFEQDK